MKVIKIILILVLVLLAIPFVAALFVPKQYTVSVATTVKKPKNQVMEYLKLLKNQNEYSEWIMADTVNSPEIVGTDGTVGAIQKWNSKNDKVGEGEQEITAITSDKIEVDLRFKRPFESQAKAATIIDSISENETKVTSEFYANDSYPMNLAGYLFGKKLIHETETKNLQNIKTILEAR